MSLKVGIVGIPNVGKSTLFNALTNNSVPSENFPFCTIDPNVGIVFVDDKRLYQINEIVQSDTIVNADITFVDIAGLIKGSASGEGLGNKFLSHIYDIDLVLEVVREFRDDNIIHVENSIDPNRDIDIIKTELILKDLETLKKLKENLLKESKKNPLYTEDINLFNKLEEILDRGDLIFEQEFSTSDLNILKKYNFLTNKKFIYLYNSEEYKPYIKNDSIYMNILFEYELSKMSKEDQRLFLKDFSIEESGISLLTKFSFDKIGLQVFFTAGEKEVRAWVIKKGTNAADASAVIHTDFKKNFIKMEVVSFEDFIKFKGWNNAKDKGFLKIVGADYILNDGDVVIVRHS
jgi:hypothetical protein